MNGINSGYRKSEISAEHTAHSFRTGRLQAVPGYLFRIRIFDVLLFRLSLQEWRPVKLLPLIRHFTCEKATVDLVDRLFRDEPARRAQFRTYLKSGAEGLIMYNSNGWIGFTWHIDLNRREQVWPNRHRHHTFVSLPRGYRPERDAFWCFSGEVNPRYRGKGVLFYLIGESYKQIRRECPTAVLYSNTDISNEPSIKTKRMMGETVAGRYRTLYLRLAGRHFCNLITTHLTGENARPRFTERLRPNRPSGHGTASDSHNSFRWQRPSVSTDPGRTQRINRPQH